MQSFNHAAAELPKYVLNTLACLQTCQAHDGGRPVRRCIHNQLTIQENAIADACPHPSGSRFVELKLPPADAQPALALASPAPPSFWSLAGPLLWRELHILTLTGNLKTFPADLQKFIAKLACSECKQHFIQDCAQNPPDCTSHEKLFAWGVDRHNSVNLRLLKPIMPVADALRLWSAPAPRAAAPAVRRCGGC